VKLDGPDRVMDAGPRTGRYIYDPMRPFGQRFVEIPMDWKPTPRKRVHLIGDGHAPFKSHADGLMYDSKSAYRRELRARGFEEIGNDMRPADFAQAPFEPTDATFDILQSASELGTPLK
jgi:hypothetical protein